MIEQTYGHLYQPYQTQEMSKFSFFHPKNGSTSEVNNGIVALYETLNSKRKGVIMGDKGGKKNKDKSQKQMASKQEHKALQMQDKQKKGAP